MKKTLVINGYHELNVPDLGVSPEMERLIKEQIQVAIDELGENWYYEIVDVYDGGID